MSWWSVLLEAVGPPDAEALTADDRRLDALADDVAEDDGVVGSHDRQYSVRLSVEADTALEAVARAQDVVRERADAAGLPPWPLVRVEAVDDARLAVELGVSNFPAVVGAAEAAALVGVSKQRLAELRRTKRDFPCPIVDLASGPVWVKSAIDTWLTGWERRPGRPRTGTDGRPSGHHAAVGPKR